MPPEPYGRTAAGQTRCSDPYGRPAGGQTIERGAWRTLAAPSRRIMQMIVIREAESAESQHGTRKRCPGVPAVVEMWSALEHVWEGRAKVVRGLLKHRRRAQRLFWRQS